VALKKLWKTLKTERRVQVSKIFEQLKKQHDEEARLYMKGFKDGDKHRKMVLKEIGESAKYIYKHRNDKDADGKVGNEAWHIMSVIDEYTINDFTGMKKFAEDKNKLDKKAKK
jgi:hypothetical protein